MPEDRAPTNTFVAFMNAAFNMVDAPVTWFREKIVEPNRSKYYWYHRRFRRVPEIDECYTDDILCKFEAEEQFRRDRGVDAGIVRILRRRRDDCYLYESPDIDRCKQMEKDFDEAELNFFIKYGDLGTHGNAVHAYMKQKHRMVAERRRAQREQEQGNDT